MWVHVDFSNGLGAGLALDNIRPLKEFALSLPYTSRRTHYE
jgi:hypothetical protein